MPHRRTGRRSDLAIRLEELRTHAQMTVPQAVEKYGRGSPRDFDEWESSVRIPDDGTLRDLARTYVADGKARAIGDELVTLARQARRSRAVEQRRKARAAASDEGRALCGVLALVALQLVDTLVG